MRIKKLELLGFKSFKDRTVVHFDEGITGIVGPNGCGKSNIVDALLWVMGEMSAKHLRGSSMEDLIFAGADGYAPMGLAEVSLTLENDGGPFPAKFARFSEIMLTRRLHRSGESEYLINKEPARLRDIQEVFMDTGAGAKGFSIVEQGAIGRIITAKPEDRRTLIEEAAGITKFKLRKRESQRKLTSTDQNLTRLLDIIGEQKRQLDSLQRQAQRAERYRRLRDEAREKDLWLTSQNFLGIHGETEEAQAKFTEAQEAEASAGSEISQSENELQALKLKVSESEALVQSRQAEHKQAQDRVQERELEIRELQFEIEQARRNKEMTGSILDQYKVRQSALVQDRDQLQGRMSEAERVAEESKALFENRRNEFENLQTRIEQSDEKLTVSRREMLTVSQSESHLEARRIAVDTQTGESAKKLEKLQASGEELTVQRGEYESRRNTVYKKLESERQLHLDLMGDVKNFEENLSSLTQQLDSRRTEADNFKDELNQVASRLYGLENLHSNFEGFQEGVKNIMMWQREQVETHADGSTSVSFQPVADVVEVPEKYELAMEASLGQRLQILLSEDNDKALNALDYLKEKNSGRSSFFTESAVVSRDEMGAANIKGEAGVEALLSDVVRVPDQHRRPLEPILDDIVVVDGIRTALRLRPLYNNKTYVTLDGDTLSPEGVLTGGAKESADSGVLKRRREIKELSLKREECAGKLSLAQLTLQKLESQHQQMMAEYENSKKLNYEKEILVTELKKDLERAENELRNAENACEQQNIEINGEEAALNSLREQLSEIDERTIEVRERKLQLETDVERLTSELQESRAGVDRHQQEVTELQVRSASKGQEAEGIRTQLNMVSESLREVEEQLSKMSEETEKSAESLTVNQIKIEESKVSLESLIREAQEAERQMSQVRDDFEQDLAKSRELEGSVSTLLHRVNDFKAGMNDAQLKLEQLKMKEQYLNDYINEKYMLNLQEVAPNYRDVEGDKVATEKELEELQAKLKRIGEVNLAAIQEYDELIERYEFLTKQYDDLQDSKEQLRKVIDRINRICSRRFKETFEQVNERFTKVFPILFGGGQARLILVENEEKGEMGIDIVSQPPGKKLQNVSLLSGGEKALTAVSLIFSIFLVKPSPFCLLDEVDAPLDDANVHRFNDLVKEMAKRSQIIVVTHNKHTMKVNKKLFGVTMQEKGVSKMVSVSLDEAQKTAEA